MDSGKRKRRIVGGWGGGELEKDIFLPDDFCLVIPWRNLLTEVCSSLFRTIV